MRCEPKLVPDNAFTLSSERGANTFKGFMNSRDELERTDHDEDLVTFLERFPNKSKLGVVLIDMHSESHFNERRGERTVGENQVRVLQAAHDNGVAIFDTRVDNQDTLRELTDAMHGSGRVYEKASGGSALKALDAEKDLAGMTHVIVMGFDARYCVSATTFGSNTYTKSGLEYVPGLLSLGFRVVTSYGVLAKGSDGFGGLEEYGYRA